MTADELSELYDTLCTAVDRLSGAGCRLHAACDAEQACKRSAPELAAARDMVRQAYLEAVRKEAK